MPQLPVPPSGLLILLRMLGGLRDVAMISIGVLAWTSPPPALEAFSDYSGYVRIWGALFLVGGLMSLFGVVAKLRTPEVIGCFITSGGFLLWAAAVLELGTDWFLVGYAVGFFSAAVGQVWRAVTVASGVFDVSLVR